MKQLSVVIPTYRREQVLVDTIEAVRALTPSPAEIIVVDQTPTHEPVVTERLQELDGTRAIRWIRSSEPSITKAMNTGLLAAASDLVLFLDDDIKPFPELIAAHLEAHRAQDATIVAGRVLQPWHRDVDTGPDEPFHFASRTPRWIDAFMAGNASVRRDRVLTLGGFDENFVRVAYNFEAEFAHRVRAAGEKIYFEPAAGIDHLKVSAGGTRAYGEHLTTIRPDHAVGAYYYILRSWGRSGLLRLFRRLFRAAATRHHLRHPWWIPLTLAAEIRGLAWALRLALAGPKLIAADQRRGGIT